MINKNTRITIEYLTTSYEEAKKELKELANWRCNKLNEENRSTDTSYSYTEWEGKEGYEIELQQETDYYEDTIVRYTLKKSIYDRLYEAIENYINNASKNELAEHYDWYGVDVGDTEDLINTMYESYCGNYDVKELNKCIKEFDKTTERR